MICPCFLETFGRKIGSHGCWMIPMQNAHGFFLGGLQATASYCKCVFSCNYARLNPSLQPKITHTVTFRSFMCQNPSYESQFQEGKPQQENVFIWFTPDTSNLIPVQTIKKIHMIICKSSLNGLKPYVKSICKSFIWLPFIHVIQFWITRLWMDHPRWGGERWERPTSQWSFESRRSESYSPAWFRADSLVIHGEVALVIIHFHRGRYMSQCLTSPN